MLRQVIVFAFLVFDCYNSVTMLAVESSDQREAPLVSVLICSYNAEKFVEATVRSVMNQTYRNLEILVLDNASSDETVVMLEGMRREDARITVYASRENLGAYGGLNYLLDRARGKYIAIQDHDDIWHTDKIKLQVGFLERSADHVGCGTAIINHYQKQNVFLLRRQPAICTVAWHTSLVFRNSGFRYNSEARVGNDFSFMKKVLCGNSRYLYNFDKPFVLRTIRADRSNLSTKWISLKNLKDILSVRMGMVDKLALLNRLFLPDWLADYVILRILLRKNLLSRGDLQKYFPSE